MLLYDFQGDTNYFWKSAPLNCVVSTRNGCAQVGMSKGRC